MRRNGDSVMRRQRHSISHSAIGLLSGSRNVHEIIRSFETIVVITNASAGFAAVVKMPRVDTWGASPFPDKGEEEKWPKYLIHYLIDWVLPIST